MVKPKYRCPKCNDPDGLFSEEVEGTNIFNRFGYLEHQVTHNVKHHMRYEICAVKVAVTRLALPNL